MPERFCHAKVEMLARTGQGCRHMRDLLFLSHRIPFPPNKGEKIRSYNVLLHLAKSYRVHLGCLIDDPADFEHVAHLCGICAEVAAFGIDKRRQRAKALAGFRPGRPLMLNYYAHHGLGRWVREVADRTDIDVIHINTVVMAPYARHLRRGRKILDMQDIDSEKWATYARDSRWPMRGVWAREARTLLAHERHAAMGCDVTFFVSEPEARRFAELAPETQDRITWFENGVDLDGFSPSLAFDNPYRGAGPHLVFTGHMDYRPNADAVTWFVTAVMPLLGRRSPAPEFHIVGANPGPDVRRLANLPGIHVTGRVPDVRPYVAHAAVSVSPLRMARGIQNKVLEAMAMGKPVIASPEAFEGVRAEAGRDLLVAAGAEATARALGEVLDGRHPGLGAAARLAVERHCPWSATLSRLDAWLEQSSGRPYGADPEHGPS